ncbi:nucleotidyl transferase AbiEii/AbiGii toxin family protein [Candidatus Poriferisodalis sp.]|uniref:nucleotidyl transferase AbiEii/AbiGii toxin family protein n=1 Tax=Candidatus Poriferisodalis sp. TaxID=3101277 RepID=UPI003C6F3093
MPETPQGARGAVARPQLDRTRASRTRADDRFAAHEREFEAAVRHVTADTGLTARQVVVDYWIVRVLYTLHLRLPADGTLSEAQPRRHHGRSAESPSVGGWAFSGGNSLSMAWGITRRFSDDIDGTLLASPRHQGSPNRHAHACRAVAEWAASDPAASCGTTIGNRVRATMLTIQPQKPR